MSESAANPDALYDQACQIRNDGDLEGAVEALLKIVDDHPDHLQSHLALGVHLQKLGRFEDALRHARKVTELAPQDPFSWVQLSVINQRCGRIMEAEDAMARSHAVQAQQQQQTQQ